MFENIIWRNYLAREAGDDSFANTWQMKGYDWNGSVRPCRHNLMFYITKAWLIAFFFTRVYIHATSDSGYIAIFYKITLKATNPRYCSIMPKLILFWAVGTITIRTMPWCTKRGRITTIKARSFIHSSINSFGSPFILWLDLFDHGVWLCNNWCR